MESPPAWLSRLSLVIAAGVFDGPLNLIMEFSKAVHDLPRLLRH